MGRGAATLRGETQERWHEASATWAAMGGRIEEGFLTSRSSFGMTGFFGVRLGD